MYLGSRHLLSCPYPPFRAVRFIPLHVPVVWKHVNDHPHDAIAVRGSYFVIDTPDPARRLSPDLFKYPPISSRLRLGTHGGWTSRRCASGQLLGGVKVGSDRTGITNWDPVGLNEIMFKCCNKTSCHPSFTIIPPANSKSWTDDYQAGLCREGHFVAALR